jgi:uncharacterized protein YecT (DUF1311 family)
MMKTSMRIILFLGAALFAQSIWAEEFVKCNLAGTQLELNACANDDFGRADADLNSTYQKLLKKVAGDSLFIKKIRIAQNAWLVFRDAELDARFSCAEDDIHRCWGSSYLMSFLARKTELTKERTRQLKQILEVGTGQ